jgi:hypothetical protein
MGVRHRGPVARKGLLPDHLITSGVIAIHEAQPQGEGVHYR